MSVPFLLLLLILGWRCLPEVRARCCLGAEEVPGGGEVLDEQEHLGRQAEEPAGCCSCR